MDTATMERIVSLVKSMQDQGLSSDQIQAELSDMVTPEDLSKILAQAGGAPAPAQAATPAPASSGEEFVPPLLESPSEAVKPAIEKIDEQRQHLERLHTSVGELHDKTDALTGASGDVKLLRDEIRELKELVMELKSLLGSIERLNTNLIETNKKMLLKLGTKD